MGWPRRSRRRIEKIVSEEVLEEKKKNSKEDSSIFIYISAVLATVCPVVSFIPSVSVIMYHAISAVGFGGGFGCPGSAPVGNTTPSPLHLTSSSPFVCLVHTVHFSLLPFPVSKREKKTKTGPPFPFLYPIHIVITPTPLCLPSAKGKGGCGRWPACLAGAEGPG